MDFLETEKVVKRYAGHLALDHVSIQVPERTIFGLLGPNGAGKTTLIRIINRITAPDEGKVWLDGRELRPEDVYQIGYMPEERGLYKKMKVGEEAIYLAQLKGLSYQEARKRLTGWFEKFDIMPWWNKKVEELSKGMQQKVQFVATIIHNPQLLIFDEPFSGFDPVNAELLKREILDMRDQGHTIIFSTHNMASVEEICDNIALIDKSRVVLSGNVQEVRNRYKTDNIVMTYRKQAEALKAVPDVFDILSVEDSKSGITSVRMHKHKDVSNSALLVSLADQVEIFSFTEEIPSMNEIFINTVAGINEVQS
ncbi:MAG: ATP-binding cassette domain-containing protein [Parabacteroides sp.]|nr:ATP-binding cassette domain-containing protein [Parabacteroides sp.]